MVERAVRARLSVFTGLVLWSPQGSLTYFSQAYDDARCN
jgi:hypothetical protein